MARNDTAFFDTTVGCLRARWHPLQEIGDERQKGILKCLNIKYASIPYRWAAPRAESLDWPGTRDCTTFGPGCPQTSLPLFDVDGIPMFGRPGQNSLAIRADHEDEFECLNLNVYTPARKANDGTATVERGKLPVLVWVHGGAYQVGSGSVDAYDGTNLVERSTQLGTPCVVVTFNYRLGLLGFFHSEAMLKDAAMQSDIPSFFRSSGNLGLVDAHYAFTWIKRHISYFGGDPESVTAIGESAGAGVVNYLSTTPHLHIHVPRIILESSTCWSIALLRPAQAQSSFAAVCSAFDIDPSSEDVVAQLRRVEVRQLMDKTGFARAAMRPVWDDVTITSDPREVLDNPGLWDDRLEAMIIGVCNNEAWMREASKLKSTNPINMEALVSGRIPGSTPGLRQRACQLYSEDCQFPWFSGPNASHQNRTHMAFEGHMRYYSPASLLTQSFVGSSTKCRRIAYRYIFSWAASNFPSEWPVTHTADILPTFLHNSLSRAELEVSRTFTDELIKFTAGDVNNLQWKGYTLREKHLNELNYAGKWTTLRESSGEFGMSTDHANLLEEITREVASTGRNGWAGMLDR